MRSRLFWTAYMVFAAGLAASVGIWQMAIGNAGAGVGEVVVALIAAAQCLLSVQGSTPRP